MSGGSSPGRQYPGRGAGVGESAGILHTHGMHEFLGRHGPVAFAHRGGAGDAPENTLEAFELAVALGYGYLETDAHLTRDGVLVAFHDERLDRVTDRAGVIAELDIAQVEAADAGYTFSPDAGRSFPFRACGIRVPRLEEILTRWPGLGVNIDPKSDACVEPLGALLNRLGAWERVCIGSFSDRRLHRIRKLSRGLACTSMGPRAVALARLAAASGLMPRLGADCVQVPLRRGPFPIVTKRFVEAAHRAGLPVHVWTVNDEATMNALLALGVDGIMSDRLQLLGDVFARHGVPLTGPTRKPGTDASRSDRSTAGA
jgi:glycerophosphoryl diester phosphodiesterase